MLDLLVDLLQVGKVVDNTQDKVVSDAWNRIKKELVDGQKTTTNSAMVEICSKNICEYCMHGNTKPIRCIFFENCGGFNGFKHFIGRKLHQ